MFPHYGWFCDCCSDSGHSFTSFVIVTIPHHSDRKAQPESRVHLYISLIDISQCHQSFGQDMVSQAYYTTTYFPLTFSLESHLMKCVEQSRTPRSIRIHLVSLHPQTKHHPLHRRSQRWPIHNILHRRPDPRLRTNTMVVIYRHSQLKLQPMGPGSSRSGHG